VNVAGPTVVNPGYVNPGMVVVPGSNAALPLGFSSLLGTIRAINGNAVTVASADGDPLTIQTTPNTKVVLNSRPSTLEDLLPSDRVKVRYDKSMKAQTLVAVRR
jgi:hypothetical protein